MAFDLNKVPAVAKGIASIFAVLLISVALLRACGIDLGIFKMSVMDISILAAAAAFVGKS
jgi:hypothetical protein